MLLLSEENMSKTRNTFTFWGREQITEKVKTFKNVGVSSGQDVLQPEVNYR